jgi:16S rRNA (adenine1518-N6/adenine1519-N6)-dimethyltransferase
VHAVELDRALEPPLRESLGGRENVELHLGDALRLDLAELRPTPTKLVSNLPYNIATPLIVESLDGLPSIELWCVMVQREVADRLFAHPSTKAYGAVSVLVQLAAERTGFHRVSRTVFRPRPNVDSALIAFRRRQLPADFARVKHLVTAAFAHRRKRLANSLELAGFAKRDDATEALRAIGRDQGVRAEELAPPEFPALAEALFA